MKEAKIRQLVPVRIFEQVIEQIRELIVQGVYQPGDKLPPEQELEEQLNVSRSSIREALRVLEFEGWIEVRRGSGTYIADYSNHKRGRIEVARWLEKREDALLELLQVREYLEGLTALLCAELAGQETIIKLREILENATRIIEKAEGDDTVDVDGLATLDTQFHLTIGRASGNSLVYELISYLIPAFQNSNKAVIFMGESLKHLLVEHRAIINAIESRDGKAAEQIMRQHIVRVRKEVQDISSKVEE